MKAIPLIAEVRNVTGKKVKKIRAAGNLPVTVYGKDVKSASLTVPIAEFQKIYRQAGETGLIELKFDKSSLHTLIADVQIDPVSRRLLHAQFHAVKLTEKIKANVPLELVGESPAVSSNVGLLLQTLNEFEVEALPVDLPEKIEVNVVLLTEVGQQVAVGDLKVPAGVEVLTPKEEIVVKVVSAVSEEAKKEAQEAAAKAAEAAATAEGGETKPATEGAAETPKEEAPAPEKK